MWCSDLPLRLRTLTALLALAALALCWAAPALAEPLAVVTARQGGVTALDRETAEQLFLGRRTTLADGRAVTIVDLPAGAERDRFYLQLTGKNPSQIRAYWSRLVFTGRSQPPREAASTDDALRLVLATPGAIAYLPLTAAQTPELLILLTLD
ncbi:hypothetical protein AAG895_04255 [Thauera sp. JM12B12]|uniref:hypothetical protein n=1 Tax=Thauera sp. JM12B12 TaxID=3142262 RepID=UPI0031F3975F